MAENLANINEAGDETFLDFPNVTLSEACSSHWLCM